MYCFNLNKCNYYFIGLTKGKEKNINQHELPPPIDTNFYYGNIVVIKTNDKHHYQHFTIEDFATVYEELFGGFEDLGSYDTETDSEGYVKITEEDYDPNLSESENQVHYDKFYNNGDDDDSFIVTSQEAINSPNNQNSKENDNNNDIQQSETSSNEYTDYTSFHTEDETESDEEIKEYLKTELYDSDE